MDPKEINNTSFCNKTVDNIVSNDLKKYIIDDHKNNNSSKKLKFCHCNDCALENKIWTDYGYNKNGLSIFSELNTDGKKLLDEDFNRIFLDYKSNSITKFVKRANIKIKNNLPNCIISAAVKPNIFNAKLTFSQEWDLWLSAGYIDWAVPMNYKTDNNDFVQNMYIIKDNLPRKFHDKIVVGISTYNQSPRAAGKKIKRLKRMSFNNISIFSYSTMVKNPNYWRKLKKYF